MEEKKVINVGTGTVTVYYERNGHPYIEIEEGYNSKPAGVYLEYPECIDELVCALTQCKK